MPGMPRDVGIRPERLRAIAGLIDLTTLEGSDTPDTVRRMCELAREPGRDRLPEPLPPVAAVCVYPLLAPVAVETLAGSPVRVATVAAGFPSAQFRLDVRLADVQAAIETGAHELDMVINRGLAIDGRDDELADEIRQVRTLCCRGGVNVLKIILETGELGPPRAIRHVAELALNAASSAPDAPAVTDGSVFLKTSTGKSHLGATNEAVRALCEVIRAHHESTGVRIGLKVSGGVRSVETVAEMLDIIVEELGEHWMRPGLLRFGASSLLETIIADLEPDEPPA